MAFICIFSMPIDRFFFRLFACFCCISFELLAFLCIFFEERSLQPLFLPFFLTCIFFFKILTEKDIKFVHISKVP